MSAQDTGGYKCNVCGMIFNTLEIWMHTPEKNIIQRLPDNDKRTEAIKKGQD